MERIGVWMVGLLLALAMASTVTAHPLGGLSGSWYNPQQSGHGVSVEILDGGRALAHWNVFDPQGRPLNLYVEGALEGPRLVGEAYTTGGMRFGVFDPAEFEIRHWGALDIEFHSCNAATLHYDADGEAGGAAYGSGTISLWRHTTIAGLACHFPNVIRPAPPGLYSGTTLLDYSPGQRPIRAAVAPDGTLWGVELLVRDSALMPHGTYFGEKGPWPLVFIGAPRAGDVATVQLQAFVNVWQRLGGTSFAQRAEAALQFSLDQTGETAGTARFEQPPVFLEATFARQPGAALARSITLAELTGSYLLDLHGQFSGWAELDQLLTVSPNGAICITDVRAAGPCQFIGRLTLPFPDFAFVEFELEDLREGGWGVFHGRGWLEQGPEGIELILAGNSGVVGLGLIGTRQ